MGGYVDICKLGHKPSLIGMNYVTSNACRGKALNSNSPFLEILGYCAELA